MQEIIEDGESSEVKAVLNDERYQSFKVSILHVFNENGFPGNPIIYSKGRISLGYHNKMPQAGWIKQQIFIFLQSGAWKPEIQC